MTDITGFLIYASLFRLAVIAAGVAAIYLGYRLFLMGTRGGDTDARVKGAGFELTLKNAAPGSVFAFFGAVLVVVMLFQGGPELVVEDLERVKDWQPNEGASVSSGTGRRIRLKGGEDMYPAPGFKALLEQGN